MTHRLTVCVDVPDGDDAEDVWVAIDALLRHGIAAIDPELKSRVSNYDNVIERLKQ